MTLPIHIDALVEASAIDRYRIEFMPQWDKELALHASCAFANDLEGTGGGYLVVGIEGAPSKGNYRIVGIDPSGSDEIRAELLDTCALIEPKCTAQCETVYYQNVPLLVAWIPAGYDTPYHAPASLMARHSAPAVFVRHASETTIAATGEVADLEELNGSIPFDGRANQNATLFDMRLRRMQEFLNMTREPYMQTASDVSIEQAARALHVCVGPSDAPRPTNAGLLMFSDDPERFVPFARIEVHIVHDAIGRDVTERVFAGSIDRQLAEALLFIQGSVCAQKTISVPGGTEETAVWNYPFAALREALGNAVCHKSYALQQPITVRVERDRLSIMSYPGPGEWIDDADFQEGILEPLHCRNRHLRDLLRRIQAVGERGTGIPTIMDALERNGSQPPLFETDAQRSYFSITFFMHDAFLDRPHLPHAGRRQPRRRSRDQLRAAVFDVLACGPASQREIAGCLGYRSLSKALREVVAELECEGAVEYTGKVGGAHTKLRLAE